MEPNNGAGVIKIYSLRPYLLEFTVVNETRKKCDNAVFVKI